MRISLYVALALIASLTSAVSIELEGPGQACEPRGVKNNRPTRYIGKRDGRVYRT